MARGVRGLRSPVCRRQEVLDLGVIQKFFTASAAAGGTRGGGGGEMRTYASFLTERSQDLLTSPSPVFSPLMSPYLINSEMSV